MNDPNKTIRTSSAGRRAAAERDGRLERAQADTRALILASEPPPVADSLRRVLAAIASVQEIPLHGDAHRDLLFEARGSVRFLARAASIEDNARRAASLAEQAEASAGDFVARFAATGRHA